MVSNKIPGIYLVPSVKSEERLRLGWGCKVNFLLVNSQVVIGGEGISLILMIGIIEDFRLLVWFFAWLVAATTWSVFVVRCCST